MRTRASITRLTTEEDTDKKIAFCAIQMIQYPIFYSAFFRRKPEEIKIS